MDLLRPTPRARQRPQPDRDPALEEFRRELGAWAEGKTDAELTERLFPAGIEWANGEFSNPAECLLQLPAEALPTSSAEVVRPTGSGSNPPTALLTWRKRLDVAERAVLELAA